jgi:hypothetical protein
MPDETTILSLPLILPAQAQKHVTHNEAIAALDLIVQLTVIDRTLAAPPALSTPGDRHIVAAGATGAWAGQSGRIALFLATGWQFVQPLAGWRAHVLAEGQTAVFDGLAWKTPSEGPLSVTRLGVAATADATNRLAVSAPATLLNHAGGGHQLKLNKATLADTASLLFQTGFGGRAEMGTAGTDDFSIKVSPDGAAFYTGVEIDAGSGQVTLPQPVLLGGQAADPALPQDGTLWLNTTTGEVKVRSAGTSFALGAGGGGGIADGDKGDITVSGAGATWTIDAGAVGLPKLADLDTGRLIGRATAGTGTPEALTAAEARALLNVANGATANQTDAALLNRANHTGTQAAATITGLAAVATSASATDLTAGTLPAARFSDTAHGTRAGGSLHATATTSVAGFMSGADKAKLDGVATGATANSADATLLNRANHTGAQAAATISDFAEAVDDRVAALLVPGANITLSYDDTANTLTVAAAGGGGGGGSPGGASGEIQWNNAGAFAGAADVEIEGGQLRLPAIATPTPPAAGGAKLFGRNVGGRFMPAFVGPSGLDSSVQPFLARNKVSFFSPIGNSTTVSASGLSLSATGTANGLNVATTNLHTRMRRLGWLVTTASTTAVVGVRHAAAQWTVGGNGAQLGGFHCVWRWGPDSGVANAAHRAFVGMRGSTAAPTDVNPSTLTLMCGMGYDSADANIQFMHNDGAGTATKIDLGPSFPKPVTNQTEVYEVALFSPPGTTQVLHYEVTNLNTGAVATGTVTTDLPTATQLLTPWSMMSVGGVSSVVGIAVMGLYIESDF